MLIEDGKKLVEYTRKTIEKHVNGHTILDLGNFDFNAGVFVTIRNYPDMMLRGCIGIPDPFLPLRKAIKEAAISACHDPRFPDLEEKELKHIVIEITILTPPQQITSSPHNYPEYIEIGKDGLIVEKGYYKGLLLPQVAVENRWNEKEFLNHTCIKAGLSPDAWLNHEIKLYKFQGEVFAEERPYGKIIYI